MDSKDDKPEESKLYKNIGLTISGSFTRHLSALLIVSDLNHTLRTSEVRELPISA